MRKLNHKQVDFLNKKQSPEVTLVMILNQLLIILIYMDSFRIEKEMLCN